MKAVWRWLALTPQHLVGVRVLEAAIGAALVFRGFTELPFAAYFWGPHGLGAGRPVTAPVLGWLVTEALETEIGATLLPLCVALAGAALVLGFRTRLACAAALFLMVVMEQRLPEIADGGDNVARLLLVYLLFALPAGATAPAGSLRVWAHNLGVVTVVAQLVVLYLTSGFLKAFGERWHNGTALYYISQVEWFSLPGLRALFQDPYLVTFAAYTTVAYQVMFPVAMVSRLKKLWILTGICFHAGIAVFMGLVTFSTVMIGLELFLFTDHEFAELIAPLKRILGGRRWTGSVRLRAPLREGVQLAVDVRQDLTQRLNELEKLQL